MKDFVTYEKALELKELGFDEPCFGYYNIKDNDLKLFSNELVDASCNSDLKYDDFKHCTAPTFSQSFRWFRENCDWPIETWIQPYLSINPRTYEGLYWRRGETESVGIYDTYEEAELACLIKLIEIVKTNQP